MTCRPAWSVALANFVAKAPINNYWKSNDYWTSTIKPGHMLPTHLFLLP